jgi:predicted O-methyltransferase YrrM
MSATPDYHLRVGARGRERLALLGRLYDPGTTAFLAASGLSAGMRVLDVGCGTGGLACWLADRVGPAGRVVAVDQSLEQLELTREEAAARGCRNVAFANRSVLDLDGLDEGFDLVFCRWVLLHVPSPLDAVRAMCRRLVPGGILVLEDCVTASTFCRPRSAAFDRFVEGWLHVSRALGIDAAVGDRLPELVLAAGCRPGRLSIHQPELATAAEKRLVAMCLEESGPVHVETGAMTASDVERTVAELEALADAPGWMAFVRNVRVSGTLPRDGR